jgi:hypothetical protein
MIGRYLYAHVSEVAAWIGLLIVVGVLFCPQYVVLLLGVLLLVVKDSSLRTLLDKGLPWMQAQLAKPIDEGASHDK